MKMFYPELLKSKRVWGGLAVVFVVIYFGAYFLAYHSSQYQMATDFVIGNRAVTDKIGKIRSQRMGFTHFEIVDHNGIGKAEFDVVLDGELSSADAYVTLKGNLGNWKVDTAKLVTKDGEEI